MFTVPEQSLASEFPVPDTARRVLEAVGGNGSRTFSNIAVAAGDRAGPVSSGTLSPLLHRLVGEKQILAVGKPLSTKASKLAQYRIADSNLRLYLAILRDVHQLILRDRAAAARKRARSALVLMARHAVDSAGPDTAISKTWMNWPSGFPGVTTTAPSSASSLVRPWRSCVPRSWREPAA